MPAAAIMLLTCGLAQAATVYKWVDESGVTHYSDQPHPGAKQIELADPQTYSAPPPRGQEAVPGLPVSQGSPYKTCELSRPATDEVFFNVTSITAKLRLDPPLRPGDKVVIGLDGKRMTDLPAAGDEYTLTSVERGTHTILAVVEDSQGKQVCQTPGITFHVRQASTLSPRSPTKPSQPHRP